MAGDTTRPETGFELEAQALNYRAGGRGGAPAAPGLAAGVPCLPGHVSVPGSQRPCPAPPASRAENKSRCLAGKQRKEEAGGRRPPTAPWEAGPRGCPSSSRSPWAQDPRVLRCHRERSGWQQEPSRQPSGAVPTPWSPRSSHLTLGAGLCVCPLGMPARSI